MSFFITQFYDPIEANIMFTPPQMLSASGRSTTLEISSVGNGAVLHKALEATEVITMRTGPALNFSSVLGISSSSLGRVQSLGSGVSTISIGSAGTARIYPFGLAVGDLAHLSLQLNIRATGQAVQLLPVTGQTSTAVSVTSTGTANLVLPTGIAGAGTFTILSTASPIADNSAFEVRASGSLSLNAYIAATSVELVGTTVDADPITLTLSLGIERASTSNATLTSTTAMSITSSGTATAI